MLDESTVQESFDITPIKWSYLRNQDEYELSVDSNGVVSDVNPQYSYWNPDEYDINFSFKILIKDVASLFGAGENAIVCSNAKIGIATSWFSKASFQRGTIEHGIIENTSSPLEVDIVGSVPKAVFRDSITLDIILYLKEAGKPSATEKHFANQPGCVLGTILTKTLLLDGVGSSFPTAYVHAGSSAPLWTITCNWDDPMSDTLADSVCLNINRDNKLFKYMNNEKGNEYFDFSLLMEIMSSAISVIIEKLRTEGYDLDDIANYNPGEASVGMMVLYLQEAHKCDFTNPVEASETIHKMIEKTLKR